MFLSTLVCNVEPDCRLLECFDDAVGWDPSLSLKYPALRPSVRQSSPVHSSSSTGPCPFPELEQLICRVCHQVCLQKCCSYVDLQEHWPIFMRNYQCAWLIDTEDERRRHAQDAGMCPSLCSTAFCSYLCQDLSFQNAPSSVPRADAEAELNLKIELRPER